MYITYFKYTNYPKRNIQKTKEAIKNIVAKKESRHNKGRKLLTKFYLLNVFTCLSYRRYAIYKHKQCFLINEITIGI